MNSLIPNTMSIDDHVKKINQAKNKVQSGIFEMAEAITNAINQLQGRQLELATRLNMSKGTISKWISIGSNKSLMSMQEKAPTSFNSLYQLSSLDNQFNKHYGREEGTKKFLELFKNKQITAFSQRNDINKVVKLHQVSLKKVRKIQSKNSINFTKKKINTILNSEIKLRILVKSKLTFNTIIVVPSKNQLERWDCFDRETLINEDYPIKSLENLNKEIFQQCFIKVKAKKLDVAIRCLRAWGFFYNNMDNLITLAISPNDPQQYTYVNVGEYSTIGSTFNTGIRYKQFNVNLGVAHVGRLNTLSALYTDVPKYNYSPEIRINSTYRNKEHRFSVAIFYKYNGQRNGFFLSDDSVSQSLINDYHLLDMNITKQLLDGKLEWTLGVKNLLDVQDITSTNGSGGVHSGNSGTIPMNWGRSFFCALKFKI